MSVPALVLGAAPARILSRIGASMPSGCAGVRALAMPELRHSSGHTPAHLRHPGRLAGRFATEVPPPSFTAFVVSHFPAAPRPRR